MKFSPLHASLMTLALFTAGTVPAHAEAAELQSGPVMLAQAKSDAAFDPIRKFLASGKDVSALDDERLQQRLSRAKRFQKAEGLPPDLAQELDQEIAALNAEIERRQQAAAEPPAQPEPQPQPEQQAEQPQPQEQPPAAQAEQAPAQPEMAPPPEAAPQADVAQQQPESGNADVAAFLQSVRPAAGLTEEEVRAQMRMAADLAKSDGISPEQRQQLRNVIREARSDLKSRETAAAEAPPPAAEQPAQQPAVEPPVQAQPETAPQPQVTQQEQASQGNADVAAFLQSVRPAAGLTVDEVRSQMRQATDLAQSDGISDEQRQSLRTVIREARGELKTREANDAAQTPPAITPEVPQQQVQQPDVQPPAEVPQVAPSASEMEKRAQAYLADSVDVSKMERRELRRRLSDIRDILASQDLSPQTRDALRQKLAQERQLLRRDVSASEDGQPQQNQQPAQQGTTENSATNNTTANTTVTNNNVTVNNTTNNTDVRVVLQDRRPAAQLDDQELVRRIDVYRDVVRDDQYAEEERMQWRRQMERDRRYLRQRMIEERRQREAELRSGSISLNIDIEDDYEPGREVPRDVFAAEVEDDELADVLTAPPRRKIERRYTVDELERSTETRDAVARIEIDTVHFGFGEGFLREEEIDKLDRIAQVLEKILAKHPDEVFLLEGHTDAVGSDAANLQLSRERAKAVKEALTTYYVIPAANLKTAGLGERFLKIPTKQAEAENRRVSLARITALVGQAD